MKDGFLKVCAATPDIRVADCGYNAEKIIGIIDAASKEGAKLVVLPELCVSGYTCSDLFMQKSLLDAVLEAVRQISEKTKSIDAVSVIGAPIEINSKLYNCAVVIYGGKILALIPKTALPNYSEFYEMRHFAAAPDEIMYVEFLGQKVPFGTNVLIKDKNIPEFVLGVEICEDLWTVIPPSSRHALAGATVIANLSAGNELIAKHEYRTELIKTQSARLISGYVYASAGEGESTTDMVFAGNNMICENGTVLAESELFCNQAVYSEIDLQKLIAERRKTTTYEMSGTNEYVTVNTEFEMKKTHLTRRFSQTPFVPNDGGERIKRCRRILLIQSMGLKKRLVHTGAKTAVVGISGGLDSTLALLVTARAFDAAKIDRKGILAVTMPCFGTTGRTYNNAVAMSESIGAKLIEVDIKKSVIQHFKDIGQDENNYDVTFENAQARERTQVLMDIANKNGGLVIGTGDLSELALGFATYNGDHMSMYGVNAGVPKTLIRYLVESEAEAARMAGNEKLALTLEDILNTPVSPELLPPKDGEIAQKTEHIVGPYILHDFFLYYAVRFGFSASKIFRIAKESFAGEIDDTIILKWEKVFYRRFFAQQFKRSCLPDGPKVGSVALSPRGDWRMPSDSSWAVWEKEIEELEKR